MQHSRMQSLITLVDLLQQLRLIMLAAAHHATHIMMMPHAGETRATEPFSGKVEQEAFSTWVAGEKIPLTLEFNEANSDKIFNSGIKKQVWLG